MPQYTMAHSQPVYTHLYIVYTGVFATGSCFDKAHVIIRHVELYGLGGFPTNLNPGGGGEHNRTAGNQDQSTEFIIIGCLQRRRKNVCSPF